MTLLGLFLNFGSILFIPVIWAIGYYFYKKNLESNAYWESYYKALDSSWEEIDCLPEEKRTKFCKELLKILSQDEPHRHSRIRVIEPAEIYWLMFLSAISCIYLPIFTVIFSVFLGADLVYLCYKKLMEKLELYRKTLNDKDYWRSVRTPQTARLTALLEEIEAAKGQSVG